MNQVDNVRKKRSGRFFPGVIVIAFAAAFLSFFLLVHIEKSMLSNYEKATVWVAAANLQKSLEITESNSFSCFVQMQVDKKLVPAGAVEDISSLEEFRTVLAIPQGTILLETMFTGESSYIEKMGQPIIAGCKSEDLYQVVSGTLRKGDFVNIYTVNQEMEETYLLWENVLVYQTFDASGNLIPPEDTVTAAARINLLMEERYAEQFYNEIAKGSLRMVKIWDV